MHYRVIYCCDSYTLADAFRPNPFWGKKGFTVDLDNATDDEVIEAAQQSAPPGYWLQRVVAYGGEPHERTVYIKAVPGAIQAAQSTHDQEAP